MPRRCSSSSSVPLLVIYSLALAVLLNTKIPGLRAIYFAPWVLSVAVVGCLGQDQGGLMVITSARWASPPSSRQCPALGLNCGGDGLVDPRISTTTTAGREHQHPGLPSIKGRGPSTARLGSSSHDYRPDAALRAVVHHHHVDHRLVSRGRFMTGPRTGGGGDGSGRWCASTMRAHCSSPGQRRRHVGAGGRGSRSWCRTLSGILLASA